MALGLSGPVETHLFVWSRDAAQPEAVLDLTDAPGLTGSDDLGVTQVFPAALPPWDTQWSSVGRTLRVSSTSGSVAARIFRLTNR